MRIVLIITVLLLVPIGSNAQQDEEIQIVQGKYLNSDIGVEFVLPDDWSGAKLPSISTILLTDAIIAAPGDIRTSNENVFILSIMSASEELDISEISDPISRMQEQGCKLLSARALTIGDLEGIEMITECSEVDDSNTVIVRNKVVLAKEPTRFISMMFISKVDRYDTYIQDFDEMLDTLKVSENNIRYLELNQITEKVVLEEEVGIDIKSSSSIDEFKFDEEDKSISFDVSGIGIVEVYPRYILEGPYTIVAEPAFLATDVENGVKIVYNNIDEIKIIGTEVVPEFPITITVLGAITSIMIIIRRFI